MVVLAIRVLVIVMWCGRAWRWVPMCLALLGCCDGDGCSCVDCLACYWHQSHSPPVCFVGVLLPIERGI